VARPERFELPAFWFVAVGRNLRELAGTERNAAKSTNCCKPALTIFPSLFTFSSRFCADFPKLVCHFYDTRVWSLRTALGAQRPDMLKLVFGEAATIGCASSQLSLRRTAWASFRCRWSKLNRYSTPRSSAAATCSRSAVRVPSLAVVCRDSSRARSKTRSGSPRNWNNPCCKSFSKSLNDEWAWTVVISFRNTRNPRALITSSSPRMDMKRSPAEARRARTAAAELPSKLYKESRKLVSA